MCFGFSVCFGGEQECKSGLLFSGCVTGIPGELDVFVLLFWMSLEIAGESAMVIMFLLF